ncbi:MAG: hypothetical protein NWS33_07415 [Burkholderiaceae bacterium]|nr:hypothetical protein [Burkholderiaceae bacterium]
MHNRTHAATDGDDELETEVVKAVVGALATEHQTLVGLHEAQGADFKRWIVVPPKYRDTAEWRLCLERLFRVTEGQGPTAGPGGSRAISVGANHYGLVVPPCKRFGASDRLKQRVVGGLCTLTGAGHVELLNADSSEQSNDGHAYQAFDEGEAARVAGSRCKRLRGDHPLSVR